MENYYVYILTNPGHTVLYIGVTSNIVRRVYEHREKLVTGFTARYNCSYLVYFEESTDVNSALEREKQLKAGSRQKKLDLIRKDNPNWEDLYVKIASH